MLDLCTSQQSAYNTRCAGILADRPANTGRKCFRLISCTTYTLAESRKLDDVAWNHQGLDDPSEQEILLKDTVGGLLWLALFDAVHHAGQLSTYIVRWEGRFGIYGPSADDTRSLAPASNDGRIQWPSTRKGGRNV